MAAVDFGAVLDESAEVLIQDTPPEPAMVGYAERVHQEFLRGTRFSLAHANLEDSRAFIEEVVANVAQAEGYKATGSDVKHWSSLSFEELEAESDSAGKNLGPLADGVAMASASAGLQVAGDVYKESLGFYSLGTGALEDGNISAQEAVQLGASASSFASTMMSSMGTGGVALGPIGAIAGLVLGGINFLTSSASSWEAYQRAQLARARAAADAEKHVVDAFLEEERAKYEQWQQQVVWRARDTAVAEVADAWAGFEDGTGVRFGLRFFPGSPIPPRAGTYRSTRIASRGGIFLSKYHGGTGGEPFECDSLSGCLYFPEPHPSRVAAIGYRDAYVEMLEQMAARDRYLTTTPNNLKNEKDYVPSRAEDFPQYAYYFRTFRAFDSFLVNPSTREQRRFWVPPAQRIKQLNWKTYEDLAYEWLCGNSRACSALDLCTNDVTCRYSSSQRKQGYDAMVSAFRYKESGGHDPKIPERARRFVESMQDKLARELHSSQVIKTRVMGDLIQTANAVTGELATSLRLEQLLGEMGDLSRLSASEQRQVTALDPQTQAKVEREQSRDAVVNNGMLATGIAAMGFGAYKKWG